ncbi:hypothetical protein IUY40_12270 [Flavobacterium sp. ALJ2]|uniref:hypothetical protein n=1 Tax=Flavobacterium sp. ALJ2 TaxID=2786960 RepID=UPI00189D8432|nr:hypothetical protein [Flavobacterium sp. ALJ2]MBF7092313.1 hypothetical protein [Flavobacterium sp. ALJ2]
MNKILYLGILIFTLFGCTNDSDITNNEFKEQKNILKTNVIDAEYSKKRDQLVYISSNPSQINIFNSNSETIESILLTHEPTCISISQDGETAVVGHDGYITYVNLETKSIINTYNVSCSVLDIVLGNNKWAYAFPKEGQWTYIRSINMNLLSNNESPISIYNQIHDGTKGRLHPSGKYIYTQAPTSHAMIKKFNIQNGDINDSYESRYNEDDYAFNPNVWFSEDGIRIFSNTRTVLKTSGIQNLDMVYNGKINPEKGSYIEWLDYSSIKNNLFLIFSNDDFWSQVKSPYIYTYNASNLTFINKLELEKYYITDNKGGGAFHDAEPFFVFSNSNGNSLFVITKAIESNLANEWGIQKINKWGIQKIAIN